MDELESKTDDSLATFAYSSAITDDGTAGTASTITLGSGGSIATNNGPIVSATTPAVLVADVDKLRLAMAAAIGVLDSKIDEILKKSTLSC